MPDPNAVPHHIPAPVHTPHGTVIGHTLDGGTIVIGAPNNVFTPEEIAALESEHRRIGRIPHAEGDYEIVIRSAKKAEWRMFRGRAHSDEERADAQEQLVMACVVAVKYRGEMATGTEPARRLLARVLDDYPAIPDDKSVSALIKKLNGDVGTGPGK